MSDTSSVTSIKELTDGRKAPFTPSVCEEVFNAVETQSSAGVTDVLERARLGVSKMV